MKSSKKKSERGWQLTPYLPPKLTTDFTDKSMNSGHRTGPTDGHVPVKLADGHVPVISFKGYRDGFRMGY